MSDLDRPRLALYVALGLVVCVLGARYLSAHGRVSGPGAGAPVGAAAPDGPATAAQAGAPTVSGGARVEGASASASVRVDRADGGRVTVHVAGAVRRPGLYRLPTGARIDDALRRAGGPGRRADLTAVNLATKLEDGRQVLVPERRTAASRAAPSMGSPAPAGAPPDAPVNLNTATIEQLDTLDGVGPGIAQRILDYREQHGGFRRVEELAEVPGIGREAAGGADPAGRAVMRSGAWRRRARVALSAGAVARRRCAQVAVAAGAVDRRRCAAIDEARDVAAAYPRHLLLAAFVGGLLAGPRWPLALAATVLLALGIARTTGVALGALAALGAGAGLADARLAALDRSALAPLMDRAVNLRATLLEHPRTRRFGTRVVAARLLSQPGRGERVLVRVPSRVSWPTRARPGSELILRGRLTALGPHDAHERRRNAHALLRAHAIRPTGRRRGGLSGALDTVRARTERALTAAAPAAQGALARGMVLGQDAALPDDLREDFRVTGLAHLVAASGANVLLLAALVLAIGTLLGLGLTARLSLALLLVALYVPLAGAGPSIQRAGVMGAAGLAAALAGRPASRWYALLLAAALTLGFNPRAADDIGWQLSFAAVLAMLALVPGLSAALRRARLPRGIAEALAVTAAATLAAAPLIALHFERLSLVSLPVNLLAAPAVAPVMWLGTIAGALGQVVPDLAVPVAGLASLPLGYLTWLADRAAAVPFAELALPSPRPIGVAAIYGAAIAGALGWRRWRTGRARRAGQRTPAARARVVVAGVACVALAAGLARASRPSHVPRDLTISFLDIGQGDATLLQHGDATVLVDTGPPDGPILARLHDAHVRRIDVLVLTHDALDHDGAAAAVLDAFPVGLVVDGEEAGAAPALGPFGARPDVPVARLAASRRLRRIASDAGQVLRAGPLELRVLWPQRQPAAPPGAEPNDRATVLHVRDGTFDLLLTADAESNVTAALDLPVVEALKVAHHGSDDPGLPGLLQRLRPEIAVIEVGAHNTYGHPTPATLAALRAVPIVRRTDRDGTVRVRVRDERIVVESVS